MKMSRLIVMVLPIVIQLLTPVLSNADTEDEMIRSAAMESYVFKNYLSDDQIEIISENGNVTLTGIVSHDFYKTLAEDTVRNIKGVKSVDNRLAVVQGVTPETDEWKSIKIKGALLLHSSVSGTRTKVFVDDSVVTLTGIAKSEAEKDLATKYAYDVGGVKYVVNEMTVDEGLDEDEDGNIDDASITAEVKSALSVHSSLSETDIKIETKDGVVTLTGKAKNKAEKDLAGEIVKDIKGVKDVINNISLE